MHDTAYLALTELKEALQLIRDTWRQYFKCSSVRRLRYKGKAIPLQVWTCPEGSRRSRLPDFKTVGTWRW